MSYDRFSVHKFTSFEDAPFKVEDYSRLKFGCDVAAKSFGYQLAEGFFAVHCDKLITNECIIIPSPYNQVENAATIMTKHFMNRLNELMVESCGRHVEYMTVQRKVSYTNDYGFLSKEKRKGLIDNDTFYFNKEYVRNKLLIFIDDVRITGTHEEKLIEILKQRRLKNNAVFLYFAEYFGDQPDIEAKINFAAVSSLDDYITMTRQPNHHVIVRPIKFLLGQSEQKFEYLLENLDQSVINKIYFGALHEGYYRIPQYQSNFQTLKHRV